MKTPQAIDRAHNVLIVSSNNSGRKEIEDLLSLTSNFHSQAISMEGVKAFKPSIDPEIIIAETSDITELQMTALSLIRQKFPQVPLLFISETLNDDAIRHLLKLNIQDWLKKPLDKKLFNAALYTNSQLVKSNAGEVHAVISAVGGVGATTIAISAADLLVKKTAKIKSEIALFDLDFSTGNCGYSLNVYNTYNLETVVSSPERVDSEFIDIIKQKHEGGFSLFSFKRPDIVVSPTGTELVLRMLDAVSMRHDLTILDIPYYETPWKDDVLSAVNTVTIVTDISLPAIKHANELCQRISKLRSDNVPIQVIFNRFERKLFGQNIKLKKLREVFKEVELAHLAEDIQTMEDAVNRGILPSKVNRRSKFIKQLGKYLEKNILSRSKAK